jgi:hypothetical protein
MVNFMKTIAYIRWADPPVWQATLANSLPLWLLSFALLPDPSFPEMPAGIFFALFMAVIAFLLWLRWFTPELILYTFFPIIPVFLFDEMSAGYETYFILLCALILTLGIFGYQLSLHKGTLGLAWLILLVIFIGTWMLASHAVQNYWQMVSNLGYGCAPDT